MIVTVVIHSLVLSPSLSLPPSCFALSILQLRNDTSHLKESTYLNLDEEERKNEHIKFAQLESQCAEWLVFVCVCTSVHTRLSIKQSDEKATTNSAVSSLKPEKYWKYHH